LADIVILSVPAYGHLNPVLPIARELVQRGHRVTVFNDASFEKLIRPTGADFAAYPDGVIQLEDFSRTLKDGDLIAWLQMIFLATAPLLASSAKALRASPPDLIVFDGVALWGEMLATKLRVPSVCISTTFTSEVLAEVTDFPQVLRNFVSILKHLPGFLWAWLAMTLQGPFNLPWRMPIIPRQGTKATLMLTSKAVHPRTRSVDNLKFVFVGSSIEPATRSEAFDFDRLDGRPLLYVSLGTLHHGNTAFFRRVGEAFADYDGQVLLSVGRGTDLTQFAGLPGNFIVAEAVPQLRILERTHVFLTHAGLNSMHESLWSGVPMVAVPQQFEQLRNAQSMAASGAGIVLDGEAWGKPVPAAALKAAVAEVSGKRDAYAAAAARLGDSLKAGGGYIEAANRIEMAARR